MKNIDILLITPPFTQLNTPYPATPFLKGFLFQHGYNTSQIDIGIETVNEIFSSNGLKDLFNSINAKSYKLSDSAKKMYKHKEKYIAIIDDAIAFLQGNNDAFAVNICNGNLPKGTRFKTITNIDFLFDSADVISKAKYLATLFIEDIGDFITTNIDTHFGFSRYAEKLGIMAKDFNTLESKLKQNTPLTSIMCKLLDTAIEKHSPKTIGITIPFPGNMFAALKLAQHIKQNHNNIPVIIGGGWVNTELRQLNEPNLFKYVDYVCLDYGERPLLQILNHIIKNNAADSLVRTYILEKDAVKYINCKDYIDFHPNETGTPDYSDLPLNKYISVLEIANPMHRLWSDGKWNKLMIAQGCYWHKCAFCDTSLDYICNYKPIKAEVICDRIEAVIKQTNHNDFHFVDEAAPPKLLKELANELIRRKLNIKWWTNIRFEIAFDNELCNLLAKSGCIAVSGGLEVLSDRLLKLMNKGVTIEQATIATNNFSNAEIMVHAYLMYGFPTQTAKETINSLEVVRQLFLNGLIQSAYWHRFVMTVHSPIGKNPKYYGVIPINNKTNSFANNDIQHKDPQGCNHDKFSYGLRKALYNYMHGICFDFDLQEWFDFKIPPTDTPSDLISKIITI